MNASVGGDGRAVLALDPGWWSVSVEADGFGARTREVVVVPGKVAAPVSFVLTPSRVQVSPTTGAIVTLVDKVKFPLDAAALSAEGRAVLEDLVALLQAHPEIAVLEVQGHTDSSGDAVYNAALAQRRAESVRDAMVGLGLPPERLRATGYAAMRPIGDNATDTGRAENRRVEFVVVEVTSVVR